MRFEWRTVLFICAAVPALGQTKDAPDLRYESPVTVASPGAFVRLPLPPEVYARSRDGALADLRVVDARGARVPFALLRARPDELGYDDVRVPVGIYPLPPQAAAQTLPAHMELRIDGGQLLLRSQAGAPRPAAAAGAASRPGWLIDLGERKPDDPVPRQVELRWSGPAEFSAGYRLDSSTDLRQWHPAGGGQVMALAGAAGAPGATTSLQQPRVALPAEPGRYLRLRWTDPAAAPAVTAADAIAEKPRSRTLDAPATLKLGASPEPAGAGPADAQAAAQAARALHLDLGAVLDLRDLDLVLPPGTQVLPLRVQRRNSPAERWTDVTAAVAYRIERPADAGGSSFSPPLTLNVRTRYLRLVPDDRAPAIDSTRTSAVARVQLASLLFAAQGTPPYRLQVGAPPKAVLTDGALPVATLVPLLDEERARFGRAELGAFTEVAAVAQQVARDEQLAAWRPRLLWAVLLAGVAGLGFMVWRLARGGAAAAHQTSSQGPGRVSGQASDRSPNQALDQALDQAPDQTPR
jgi:hypothetical protein